jgi:hypothetical protein
MTGRGAAFLDARRPRGGDWRKLPYLSWLPVTEFLKGSRMSNLTPEVGVLGMLEVTDDVSGATSPGELIAELFGTRMSCSRLSWLGHGSL